MRESYNGLGQFAFPGVRRLHAIDGLFAQTLASGVARLVRQRTGSRSVFLENGSGGFKVRPMKFLFRPMSMPTNMITSGGKRQNSTLRVWRAKQVESSYANMRNPLWVDGKN